MQTFSVPAGHGGKATGIQKAEAKRDTAQHAPRLRRASAKSCLLATPTQLKGNSEEGPQVWGEGGGHGRWGRASQGDLTGGEGPQEGTWEVGKGRMGWGNMGGGEGPQQGDLTGGEGPHGGMSESELDITGQGVGQKGVFQTEDLKCKKVLC